MRLLAIDTSTSTLSAALAEGENIIGQFGLNTGKNHSIGLLPLLDALLAQSGLSLGEMDAFAVTVGPGSFTGLRIGLATVKAWGDALDKPLVPVSTLDALALTMEGGGLTCPVLDARRNEVYTALYRDGRRISPDEAVAPATLAQRLAAYQEPVTLGGDGLLPYEEIFAAALGDRYRPASPERRLFLAPAAALIGQKLLAKGNTVTPPALRPVYLRLSEAEEKRLAKEQQEQNQEQK